MTNRLDARWIARLIVGAVLATCGCADNAPKPRSRDELFAEKQSLPRLYLTNETHTRVVAPKHKGTFVDEKTGETCWPAFQCTNPDCPGRTPTEPYLFTTNDVKTFNGCPACAKTRNYKADTKQQQAENLKFIKEYDLPDVVQRAKAIDDEISRSFEWERSFKK